MFKNAILITATAASLALGATGMARALELPDYAPVPVSRAEALMELQQAKIVHRPVAQIGTEAQAIPAERQEVRVIGARFLPPLAESLDLRKSTQSSTVVATLEDASVWLLRTASAGMFGEAIAAQDVASIETE